MSVLTVPSHAKINWSLRILGRRPDGYHDLETLFQLISLHDTLVLREADRFTLTCDDPSIPTDDSNLVVRAVRELGSPPVAIELRKRIPAGGGLGGGSSNAAVTLQTLDRMFGMQRPDLPEIALRLGSDVPFFLLGGPAFGTGRGEVLEPIALQAGVPLLLLLPEERVSTKEAFARVERYSPAIGLAAHHGYASCRNDFEEPVFAMLPRLARLKERLLEAGAAWAGMSGSGSTVFGAFESPAARDLAAGRFTDVRFEACETL